MLLFPAPVNLAMPLGRRAAGLARRRWLRSCVIAAAVAAPRRGAGAPPSQPVPATRGAILDVDRYDNTKHPTPNGPTTSDGPHWYTRSSPQKRGSRGR